MTNMTRFLTAKSQDGAIVLEPSDSQGSIMILGASVQTNWPESWTSGGLHSVILYPKQGEKGLVALSVWGRTGGTDNKGRPSYGYLPAFLEITEKDGQPWINLDQTWSPTKRAGSISDYCLETEVNGRHFAYHRLRLNKDNKKVSSCDPNLLCRYLYGTASAADVLRAAVQAKVEPLAQKRVEVLVNENRMLYGQNRVLAHDVRRLNHKVESLEIDNVYLEQARKTDRLSYKFFQWLKSIRQQVSSATA